MNSKGPKSKSDSDIINTSIEYNASLGKFAPLEPALRCQIYAEYFKPASSFDIAQLNQLCNGQKINVILNAGGPHLMLLKANTVMQHEAKEVRCLSEPCTDSFSLKSQFADGS
jgi:hypothetical protein